jgi:hypothetical protein
VIGHLYIPFQCNRLNVTENGVVEITKELGDGDRRCSYLSILEPFIRPELMTPSTIYHRLPVWLIAMPLPGKIVSCLYVATHLPGGFYPNQQYPDADDPHSPCFVDKIGEHLSEDAVYFPDIDNEYLVGFDYNTLYVHVADSGITAIGSRIDDLGNFQCDLVLASVMDYEIPTWLDEHPVERFLQLTTDSGAAKLFALSRRKFFGRKWDGGDDTIFRPVFRDAVRQHTPGLQQNTIAAYLLRNLVDVGGKTIFGALKDDVLIKYSAAKEIIDGKVWRFRKRYDSN